MVNNQLHKEFDEFKTHELSPNYSYLPLIELLEYYCLFKCTDLERSKIAKLYLQLQSEEIDTLVEWVYEMRTRYKRDHENIFETQLVEAMVGKSNSKLLEFPIAVIQSFDLNYRVSVQQPGNQKEDHHK